MATSDEDLSDHTFPNLAIPSFLMEAPDRSLFLQPSSSAESLSHIADAVTMTTSSGAIVTTVTTESRRNSSVVPFHVVTPSRRNSLLETSYPTQLFPSTGHDRIQSLSQQVHHLQFTTTFLEDQSKEWQASSSHLLETQIEKSDVNCRRIAENQQRLQELQTELNKLKNKDYNNYNSCNNGDRWQTLFIVGIAIFSFILGRMTN